MTYVNTQDTHNFAFTKRAIHADETYIIIMHMYTHVHTNVYMYKLGQTAINSMTLYCGIETQHHSSEDESFKGLVSALTAG